MNDAEWALVSVIVGIVCVALEIAAVWWGIRYIKRGGRR